MTLTDKTIIFACHFIWIIAFSKILNKIKFTKCDKQKAKIHKLLLIKPNLIFLVMLNLNYIIDSSGNQIEVQIPIADWLLFQREFEDIKRKLEILQGIKDALHEVRKAKTEKRKLQPLKEFLN